MQINGLNLTHHTVVAVIHDFTSHCNCGPMPLWWLVMHYTICSVVRFPLKTQNLESGDFVRAWLGICWLRTAQSAWRTTRLREVLRSGCLLAAHGAESWRTARPREVTRVYMSCFREQ
jgi:hypothetical protein